MPNFLTSLLRTYVPIAVGALVSWLLTLGIELDAETQAGLIVALTGLSQAAYYALVRALEPHMPDWLTRVLIGSAASPVYVKSDEFATIAPQTAVVIVEDHLTVRPPE